MTLQTQTRRIMGTAISITLESEKQASQDIEDCFDIFTSYEKEFSRFDPTSELSQLNQQKTITPSDRFFRVMELSDRIYQETGGIFNPLINLSHIGYGKSFETGEFQSIGQQGNMDWNTVYITHGSISLQPDQMIDLGGIIKGYSVDEVRNFLFTKGYTDFIINAGGDIYLAGKENPTTPWTVGIDNPLAPGEIIATLEVSDRSIATSGTYKRTWKTAGNTYHHIIDPRTGTNPDEIISISILGHHTWMTDVYATVGLIMGKEACMSWLRTKNLDAIIITKDGEIYTTDAIEQYNPVFFT